MFRCKSRQIRYATTLRHVYDVTCMEWRFWERSGRYALPQQQQQAKVMSAVGVKTATFLVSSRVFGLRTLYSVLCVVGYDETAQLTGTGLEISSHLLTLCEHQLAIFILL